MGHTHSVILYQDRIGIYALICFCMEGGWRLGCPTLIGCMWYLFVLVLWSTQPVSLSLRQPSSKLLSGEPLKSAMWHLVYCPRDLGNFCFYGNSFSNCSFGTLVMLWRWGCWHSDHFGVNEASAIGNICLLERSSKIPLRLFFLTFFLCQLILVSLTCFPTFFLVPVYQCLFSSSLCQRPPSYFDAFLILHTSPSRVSPSITFSSVAPFLRVPAITLS